MDVQAPPIIDLETSTGLVLQVRREGWLYALRRFTPETNGFIFCSREELMETLALLAGMRMDDLDDRAELRSLARRACELSR